MIRSYGMDDCRIRLKTSKQKFMFDRTISQHHFEYFKTIQAMKRAVTDKQMLRSYTRKYVRRLTRQM